MDTLITKNIKDGNPELNKNIYYIVPEQFSFEFDKKLYETIGEHEDFNNQHSYFQSLYESVGAYKYNSINVNKFSKLAEDIITRYGSVSQNYINKLSRAIAMYQAISALKSSGGLHVFEKQANNIDFVRLALNQVVDLKKSNISADELRAKSKDFPKQVMEKVEDMANIYSKYDEILKEKNLQDSTSDIINCCQIAETHDFFNGATIFIDEFDAFTLDELALIEVMIHQCNDLYITLRTDNPNNTKPSYFEPVNDTYKQLNAIAYAHSIPTITISCDRTYRYASDDLKHVSESIFTHGRKYKFKSHRDINITQCDNYYQECDYVCSQIRKLIMEGYSYRDIFVTARHVDDYLGIIERAFENYNIPYFLSTDRSSIYTPVMVYFINLLDIISSKNFDTDTVLRYVKNPITNVPFENVSDLENYCYKWSVKKSMWDEPFQQDDNTTAELTRLNVIKPLVALKENIKDKPCIEVCKYIYSYMDEQGIIQNVQDIIDRNRSQNQDVVASDMARLWDMLMTILDTLCTFMGDDVIPIKHFKEIICAMISQSDYKVAPQKLDAVNFSECDNSRFNSPPVLFILGANDGTFPSSVDTTGIFTNSDMKHFETVELNFFKSIKDKTADEKLIVYKTLSAPAEKLYISYALKNTMGDLKYPSYVVDSVRSLFENLPVNDANELPVEELCSTYRASYEYYVKHFWDKSRELTTVREVLLNDSEYASKVEYLDRVSKNEDLKIQDKNIAMKLFRNKIKIYATKFETFNRCHFQYFCSEGLRIRKPVKYDISKIEIGNIIHYCLEKIISSHSKQDFVELSDIAIRHEIDDFAKQYKEESLGGDYGKTQRFDSNFKRIKGSIFQTLKHIQKEFSQLEFVPSDFELTVDEYGDCPPLSITNEDGMEVLLCGKVDRVDILENENGSYVRVVDYKSGKQKFETSKIPYGIDMQMFLYLFAITGKNGKYSESSPAGVLYLPVSELRVKDKLRDSSESVAKEIDKHYKMKGVVLDDASVIQAMERELKGVYIPFTTGRGKQFNMTLTAEQFDRIREHAKNLLVHMANCLSNGDISTRDLVLFNKDDSPCKYCDYWGICGNYPDRVCDFKLKEDAKKLYNDIIGKNEDED